MTLSLLANCALGLAGVLLAAGVALLMFRLCRKGSARKRL